MIKYINYEMCKKCGGICCKQTGCVYLPKDFKKLEFNYLINLLNEGNISISGQPTPFPLIKDAWTYIPYLRARNQDAEIVDLITKGGPCKLLTDTGCSLKESLRPSMGLSIKPTVLGGPCQNMYTGDIASEWLEHSELLTQLVKFYTHKDIPDIISKQLYDRLDTISKKIKLSIELTETEKSIIVWYKQIMCNKPYYTPEEVKILIKR